MEIYNNTLIKLIVRQGTDLDRKKIVFSSGEPAFTTDTSRLYVGNGTLSGGVPVSNINLGSTTDLTALDPGIVGDIAFNSDSNSLFNIIKNDGSTLSDWSKIGGVYSGSDTIEVDANNVISVKNSNLIYARYDGTTSTLLYSSNINTVTNLSTGHYRFTFGPLADASYIPLTQIIGLSSLSYAPRVIGMTLSSCDVIVTNTVNIKRAADIVLSINY
jgi:hypothetical protein